MRVSGHRAAGAGHLVQRLRWVEGPQGDRRLDRIEQRGRFDRRLVLAGIGAGGERDRHTHRTGDERRQGDEHEESPFAAEEQPTIVEPAPIVVERGEGHREDADGDQCPRPDAERCRQGDHAR